MMRGAVLGRSTDKKNGKKMNEVSHEKTYRIALYCKPQNGKCKEVDELRVELVSSVNRELPVKLTERSI